MLRKLLNRFGYVHKSDLPSVPVEKAISDFGQLAVPTQHGRREVAAWVTDKHEHIANLRGAAYIAIGAIARRVAMQEAEISIVHNKKSGEDEEPAPYDHPLRQLFREVNAIHTEYDLWFYTIMWRLATGDAYLWKLRNGFRVPTELWPLPSQWVYAMPSRENFVDAYKVRAIFGEDKTLPAEDVIHIMEPGINWSTNGRFYGFSPMTAAAFMIDIEVAMLKQIWHRFRNFVPPGIVVTPDKDMLPGGFDTAKMMQIYQWVFAQHALHEHSGKPMVMPAGVQVDEFAKSIREMDYAHSLDKAMEYILAIFGVPDAVVGRSRSFNRANLEAAVEAFAQNTINPLLKHMSQHMTQGLAVDFDKRLRIKFPLISSRDDELIARYIEMGLKQGVMTPNEVRDVMTREGVANLGPLPDGDTPMVPASVTPRPDGEQQAAKRAVRKLMRQRVGNRSNRTNRVFQGGPDGNGRTSVR